MYAATSGPNVKWGAPISNGGAGGAGDGPGTSSVLALHRQQLNTSKKRTLVQLTTSIT